MDDDGNWQPEYRRFTLQALQAYVNLRSLPGDRLLYFDQDVEVDCEHAGQFFTIDGDFEDEVASCIERIVELLVSNFSSTLETR